jgi:Na+/H+-dicarboxylate symporter
VVPEALRAVTPNTHESLGAWLTGLIPTNIVQAASGSEILPLLVFTVLFALAATRVAPDRLDLLLRVGRALADMSMVVVHWIIRITPIGVFALSLVMAAGAGWGAAGFMGTFVLVSCVLMLAFTVLLYPITALLGRVSMRRFARAVAPAQLVAASTRSSIASLPALVEGARDGLRLPAAATGFVLPLTIAAFRVNMTITGPVRLILITHVFGLPLTPGIIVTLVTSVIMVSFTSLGVPGGGGAMRNLPAYLAAGLPIEAIVLLEAVDVIPDIFKTVLNVTGDMSVAAILSRGASADAAA